MGLRWERAVGLLVAILLMMAVALTVVGALPAQAAESTSSEGSLVVSVEADGSSFDFYGGGSFGSYRASFSTWGNSWG